MKKRTLQTFALTLLLTSGVFAQVGTTSFDQNSTDRPGDNNTFIGYESGNSSLSGYDNTALGSNTGERMSSGRQNTFLGAYAGSSITYSSWNTMIGAEAGMESTAGYYNVFVGFRAGKFTTGTGNVFLGGYAGQTNTRGTHNIFLGNYSGNDNTTGSNNIFLGRNTGGNNLTGRNNVFLGYQSGLRTTAGSNNLFLGYQAGYSETGDDKLYIENSNSTTPLIYGDFETDELVFNGKVSTGLGNDSFPTTTAGGTDISEYTLFVKGGLLSEELRVLTGWADYVFYDSYELKSLNEVENFIDKNGHLPNIPSAKEVESSGIEVGEMTKLQQEKIEELTLYTIQQQKEIDELKLLVNQLVVAKKQ